MWLSRSWTTRARREGESEDAYVFVERSVFERQARAGGFIEWAEFLGNLYGTPWPDPPQGADVLLEIDVQGARQVKERDPSAVVVLLVPPSTEEQQDRLRARGDPDEKVALRLAKGIEEVEAGRALADHIVVNGSLGSVLEEVRCIIALHRQRAASETAGSAPEEPDA